MSDYAILKIKVDNIELYKAHIDKHNKSLSDPFANSGFDLFIPREICFDSEETVFIDHEISCEMEYDGKPAAFFLFPRSSISKTPLLMANHTGIIDCGYRGTLITAVRNLSRQPFIVQENTKLFQICHPSLCRIFVEIVYKLSITTRNNGCFGSTGK